MTVTTSALQPVAPLTREAVYKRTVSLLRVVLLVQAALLLALSPLAMRPAFAKDASGQPVVVSLGDSYSSGEGTEPFYGQSSSNKHNNEDWLAHRSELAWPGKLQVGGATMADGKDDTWFFVAASAALIKNVTTDPQTITWTERTSSGSLQYPPQINVFSTKGVKNTVDYVTITLGGNDLGFRDIMTTAATQNIPFVSSGDLESRINQSLSDLDSKVLPNLKTTYQALLDATGDQATIVVVGYPRLLYSRVSNTFFNSSKASLINSTCDTFDTKMASLVAEMDTERIVFVDPRDAFSGHEAYASDAYINSIILGPEDQDIDQTLGILGVSCYSMHPNAKGQTAYASAVQAKIDELEAGQNPTVAVENITVAPTTAKLTAAGATTQLTATITPENATNRDYTWTSSNKAVATVSDTGLVTAVANGTATITATTADGGKAASCAVAVDIPANSYTIRFVNWDGSLLASMSCTEGEVPEYDGPTPTKDATVEHTYTFSDWDSQLVAATKDATYTAQFSSAKRQYTITWKNGADTLKTEQVAYGETPSYDGDEPARAADAEYTYAFSGWSPELAAVTGDATYTAQFEATPITPDIPPVAGEWKRLAGSNRYETMGTIVDAGMDGWTRGRAVLATGQNFPDALVASSVAGELGCPVVLTWPGELTDEARERLLELDVEEVWIMGSDKTVSDDVVRGLEGMGIERGRVSRIAGTDRQATSLEAMRWLDERGAYDGTVVIASGFSFPDALAIGPWCYRGSVPILLADGRGELSEGQWAALEGDGGTSTKAKDVIVLGGTDRVSQATRDRIGGIVGEGNMTELAGGSRYETAQMIAEWEMEAEQGMSATNVTVAKGSNFPDALAGAALCGQNNSVMLLCNGNVENDNAYVLSFVATHREEVDCGYVLGSADSVTEELYQRLRSLTEAVH